MNNIIKKQIQKKSQPKVLVTGGCGFIGLNLIEHLVLEDYGDIWILDNLSTGSQENLENLLKEHGELSIETNGTKTAYTLRTSSEYKNANYKSIKLFIGDIINYQTWHFFHQTQNI